MNARLLLLALLLSACGSSDTSVATHTGAILPDGKGIEVESEEIDVESGSTVVDELEETESLQSVSGALLQSYYQAKEVRMLVEERLLQNEGQDLSAMQSAYEGFSDDVDALKYYADTAEREPLTKEENMIVLELTQSIGQAMTLFDQWLSLR